MPNAMDGVSLVRNGDHHKNNHEETSRRVSSSVVDLGVEENSNGSSNGREDADVDGDMIRLMSTKDKDKRGSGSRMVSSSHHHHHSSHHRHHPASAHHHHSSSRSNYCQFETPADESRGTFPDDFDEELFISTVQLVENSTEPRQFDEEIDSNHHPHHNHLNHGLNLDTADHSESSDIEEIMYPSTNNSVGATTTPTSSSSSNSNSNSYNNSSSSGSSSSKNPHGPSNSRTLVTSSSIAVIINGSSEEEPMHQDLSDNADGSSKETTKRLLVDESYSQDDPEDYCVNDSEDPHGSNASASTSPMRKRKWVTDESLPAKKTIKEQEGRDPSDNRILPYGSPLEAIDVDEDDDTEHSALAISSAAVEPPMLDEWLTTFTNWNHIERLTAINTLIQTAESSEVRHMMRIIEPQFQRDFISLLPKELALYVLNNLEPKDLLQAAQTCRYWRILCDDSLLWKEKCREAGIGPFSAMAQRIHNRRSRGTQQNGCTRNCAGGSDNSCNSSCEPWKEAFLRQHNVEMNWRFQPIRPAKTLKGHDDHVITCLQFSANRIVSGSDDNTLKVWSANTGKCLRTLVGHTGGVWSSQMSGTTIVSGSTDRTLRVWNADTGACLHTLYGHTSTVRCMHLFDRKVVSGSRDATLRVWNVDSGECLHVLVGHLAAVRCVQYNGKIVVSGAYDYMVRVWDAESEECLHQLSGHTNRVYSLQFDGIHVVSGSLDTTIRVWDVRNGTLKHTLLGHQSLTSGMELRDNLLVSGNADSTVKIWDINTGQCLLTLSGSNKHLSAVTCLQLINKFVITSSDDGTVKLWDISTGDFVRNLVTLTSGGSGGVVWRIRASETKLVCAVGSRNGTEETKLLVLDFDVDASKSDEGKSDTISLLKSNEPHSAFKKTH